MSSKTCDCQQMAFNCVEAMDGGVTIAAILQTSVLAPHFAPRMTSGERYCLVWMSFVKW